MPMFNRLLPMLETDTSWIDNPNNFLESMLMIGRGDYRIEYCYNKIYHGKINKENNRIYEDIMSNE